MNLRTLTLAASLAVAAVPLPSQAAPTSTAAFDACVKAFVEAYLPNHPVRQTKTVVPSNPVPLTLWQRKYTIALSARGVESGAVLAQARCIANNNGIVLVLDSPATNYIADADFVVTVSKRKS